MPTTHWTGVLIVTQVLGLWRGCLSPALFLQGVTQVPSMPSSATPLCLINF